MIFEISFSFCLSCPFPQPHALASLGAKLRGIHFVMKIGVSLTGTLSHSGRSDSHPFWTTQVPFIQHGQKDSLAKSNIFLTPPLQGLTASLWLHSDSRSIPVIYLEDKCRDMAPPLRSYLHSFCCWTQTDIKHELSLGSVWDSCPCCPLPAACAHSMTVLLHCSAKAETSLCHQHGVTERPQTQPRTSC